MTDFEQPSLSFLYCMEVPSGVWHFEAADYIGILAIRYGPQFATDNIAHSRHGKSSCIGHYSKPTMPLMIYIGVLLGIHCYSAMAVLLMLFDKTSPKEMK